MCTVLLPPGVNPIADNKYIYIYRVSQDLRSLIRDLIPELMLSQKRHIHVGPNGNGSGVMSFCSTVNKLEKKEEHCACIEICC